MRAKYLFGDIVVVDTDLIGVIVASWDGRQHGRGFWYEVYVRSYRAIREYNEADVERYRVRHKYLDEEESEWQNG